MESLNENSIKREQHKGNRAQRVKYLSLGGNTIGLAGLTGCLANSSLLVLVIPGANLEVRGAILWKTGANRLIITVDDVTF